MATAHALTRPQRGGQFTPVRPLPEVLPMFLHDPAVRAAHPSLHVGLLLLRRADRLTLDAGANGAAPTCGSAHPVARLCAGRAAEAGLCAAVFDLDRIAGTLEVRLATGQERFEGTGGTLSRPRPGELVFLRTPPAG